MPSERVLLVPERSDYIRRAGLFKQLKGPKGTGAKRKEVRGLQVMGDHEIPIQKKGRDRHYLPASCLKAEDEGK